jgi:hypothetical protein
MQSTMNTENRRGRAKGRPEGAGFMGVLRKAVNSEWNEW